MTTLHLIVSGYVQGIGFRKWIKRQADIHHITGWVKNREDGAVELVIQGSDTQQFIEMVRLGPPLASVTAVTTDVITHTPIYTEFCVIQ